MFHLEGMPKMIQVRNVPEALHRELVERARARGQTLTDYVQAILEREVARPPREEVFERLAGRERVGLRTPAAELLREERERRGTS
jgi:plasmid stability protein